MTARDTEIVADLVAHAGSEATAAIVRVCATAPAALRMKILVGTHAYFEARSVALRDAGLGVPAAAVRELAAIQGAKLEEVGLAPPPATSRRSPRP